jgi:hypothetical protein
MSNCMMLKKGRYSMPNENHWVNRAVLFINTTRQRASISVVVNIKSIKVTYKEKENKTLIPAFLFFNFAE